MKQKLVTPYVISVPLIKSEMNLPLEEGYFMEFSESDLYLLWDTFMKINKECESMIDMYEMDEIDGLEKLNKCLIIIDQKLNEIKNKKLIQMLTEFKILVIKAKGAAERIIFYF